MSLVSSVSLAVPSSSYAAPILPTTGLSVDAALRTARLNRTATLSINDSAANVARNLAALQKISGRISSITSDDSPPRLSVSADDFRRFERILDKWGQTSGNEVAVNGIRAAAALSIAGNASKAYVTRFNVIDSVTNLQTRLDTLNNLANAGRLGAVRLAGEATPIRLTTDQLRDDAAVLQIIDNSQNGAYKLAVTGATVAQALDLDTNYLPKIKGNAKVQTISIRDNSSAVQAHLDELQQLGVRVKAISNKDVGVMSLDVSGTQYIADSSVFARIIDGYTLHVQGARSSQASRLVADRKVVSIDIEDNSAALTRNWKTLVQLSDSLNSVTISDSSNALSLTADQYLLGSGVLAKLTSKASEPNFWLKLTGVASGEVQSIASTNPYNIKQIEVSDSSADVSENLEALRTIVAAQSPSVTLTAIRLTDKASQLKMSYSAYGANSTQQVLGLITPGSYTLALTDISVADAKTFLNAGGTDSNRTQALWIKDNAANIKNSANLQFMDSLGRRLKSIEQTDAGTSLLLSVTDFLKYSATLGKIQGGFTTSLTDAKASQVSVLANDQRVVGIDVADTGVAIVGNWSTLIDNKLLIDNIKVTDANAKTLALSADHFQQALDNGLFSATNFSSADANDSAVKLTIFGASVSQALSIASANAPTHTSVAEINVLDTAVEIGAKLHELASLGGANGKLKSITSLAARTPFSLDDDDLVGVTPALSLIRGGNYTLALTGVSAAAALTLANNRKVVSIAVNDTASSIATKLDEMQSIGKRLTTITQTNPSTALQLTQSQYLGDQSTLMKIAGGYSAQVSEATSSRIGSIASDTHVTSISITDTAAAVGQFWGSILSAGNKLTSITLSDDTPVVQLSYDQWSSGTSGLNKIDGTNFQIALTSVSAANAQAVAVANTTGKSGSSQVSSIQVSDQIQNIQAELAHLVANTRVNADGMTARLQVLNSNGPLQLSFAQYDDSDTSRLTSRMYAGSTLQKLSVADVPYGDIGRMSDSQVASFSLSADGVTVSSHIADLMSQTKLSSIHLSDGTPPLLEMNQAQFLSGTDFLDLIDRPGAAAGEPAFDIKISSATVGKIDDIFQDSPYADAVADVEFVDTSANISDRFDDLLKLGSTVSKITITDPSNALQIDQKQWLGAIQAVNNVPGTSLIDRIQGTVTVSPSLDISEVEAGNAAVIAGNSRVRSISVLDTSPGIAANWDALVNLYKNSPGKLTSITVSDDLKISLTTAQASSADAQAMITALGLSDSYTISDPQT